MPELPEVETVVGDLKKRVIGRRILKVWFDWGRLIKDPKPREFAERLRGAKILGAARRGKNILIYLDKDRLLLIHQKMTGHLLIGEWLVKKIGKKETAINKNKGNLAEKVNSYIHLIFYLDNGKMLGLSDARKFAKVVLGNRSEIENSEHLNLGPEPLHKLFTFKKFEELIRPERRKVKQVLLDQEIIAGIGNIYSDDILWMAKVHPFRPASSLNAKELKAIYKAIRSILKKAVRLRGTSTSDFRDTEGRRGNYTNVRLVYGREGEECKRCKTKIKRVKMGGRSAHFCPKCQSLV